MSVLSDLNEKVRLNSGDDRLSVQPGEPGEKGDKPIPGSAQPGVPGTGNGEGGGDDL